MFRLLTPIQSSACKTTNMTAGRPQCITLTHFCGINLAFQCFFFFFNGLELFCFLLLSIHSLLIVPAFGFQLTQCELSLPILVFPFSLFTWSSSFLCIRHVLAGQYLLRESVYVHETSD